MLSEQRFLAHPSGQDALVGKREAPYDPNFPPNLNISPLAVAGPSRNRPNRESGNAISEEDREDSDGDVWGQGEAIGRYGIAGRVWCVAS